MQYQSIRLKNEFLELELSALGGCIAELNFNRDGVWLPLMRRASGFSTFADAACYPMAPYCGRLTAPDGRPGVLVWAGREYPLGDVAYQKAFAIHGSACRLVWQLQQSGQNAILECADRFHAEWSALYPFKFSIISKYRLMGAAILCETKLTNTGDGAMPAAFGYHPYWMLSPAGAAERVQLRFAAQGVYPKRDGILLPIGNPDALPAELDFSGWRELPHGLDHGFAAVSGPLGIRWPVSGIAAEIELEPPFRHAVVYTPPPEETPSFCLEWQTCAGNAYALDAAGVASGLAVISPGESLVAEWRLEVRKI